MTRYSKTKPSLRLVPGRKWMAEGDPYSLLPGKTFVDIADDLRLKRALRRAVKSEAAPQYLIDFIRENIRR